VSHQSSQSLWNRVEGPLDEFTESVFVELHEVHCPASHDPARTRQNGPLGHHDCVPSTNPVPRRVSAVRFIVWFGAVSALSDVVYEGARSIIGPLLATFGASATAVGVVTGIGEGVALVLRLVTGPVSDRTGRPWPQTI